MKIEDLKDCPQWIKDAQTFEADVNLVNGVIIWRGGDWHGGVWHGGVWHGGDWHGGVWRGGDWYGGVWRGGVWRGGDWHGGVWHGGDWHGGDWHDGVWHGGGWHGGDWHGGDWYGGTVKSKVVTRILTLTYCESYPKTLVAVNGVAYILAGCQFFTLAAARKHWADRQDRPITRAMLVGIAAVAKDWGLTEE